MATIHVVGLGAGPLDHLNAEVQHLLASARHLVLRTTDHPVAAQLRELGVSFSDFDAVSAGDPGAAREIADSLRCRAGEHGDVVYVVSQARPLLDPVVPLLCDHPDLTLVIHPGPGGGGEETAEPHATFEQLVEIMLRLRGPDGCLWDREQTHASLAPHLIEEAYEVVDTIEQGESEALAEELGDLLLQIVFHAQIAADEGRFEISDVLAGIITKLIRRHPHIFADVEVETAADVSVNWERIKREEKRRGAGALAGVLPSLPALMYAEKLQGKAAGVGFDWDEYRQVIDKVREELSEVADAKEMGGDVEAEIGDVLFAVVNLARFLDVDCETALRGVCARFVGRFETMERVATERDMVFADLSLEEKEKLWQEAKAWRKR